MQQALMPVVRELVPVGRSQTQHCLHPRHTPGIRCALQMSPDVDGWGCHEFVRPIFLGLVSPISLSCLPPESASTHWSPHPFWACCCCCWSPFCCSASPHRPPGRTCSFTTYSRHQCEALPSRQPPISTTVLPAVTAVSTGPTSRSCVM